MNKVTLFAVSVVLAASFSHDVSAQSKRAPIISYEDQILGLGERFPSARDVSQSENFHVYRFEEKGITFIQVNSLDGEVLAAFGVAGKQPFTLPIGSLSQSQTYIAQGSSAATTLGGPDVTISAECPCSAQVVYEGPEGRIVVVYGAGGEVIQVFFLPAPERV